MLTVLSRVRQGIGKHGFGLVKGYSMVLQILSGLLWIPFECDSHVWPRLALRSARLPVSAE